jgi:class 3 adenylate cyclase
MPTEIESLEAAIAALEGQRALLGDAVVDAALGPMRSRLGTLRPTRIQETAQTLRQVTVLFLDVVGSTHLSQYLDPEDLHAVMDCALARFTEVVQSHGGKVLNSAGDSVLAVFGIDEASEDDVERAIRCGLALLQAGRDLGARVLSEHGQAGFNVRVGVHTGGVLIGDGVDGEGSIRGLTVNVAARMEQTAPPGGLRISHDAYRHVRGVFDVEVQPPIAVKGVDEPIQTYLVERAKPRAFRVANRGIEGVETRMIGREAELEHLKEAFRRSIANRRLMSVMVSGEAGVGKSRLLHEFENWAEAEPDSFHFFQGRASPHTENQPFGLLRDILAWRLQISDEATMASAREKLEAGIVPLFVVEEGRARAESYAHLLGHLIGLDFRESPHLRGILDDPKQIRNRAFHALAQTFRRTAAKDDSPIVLQLDDLHWADNETLDFLEYLREVNEDVPLLIIGLTRPALFDRRPDWHRGAENWERLNLQPLDKALSRSLAEELLKKLPKVPTALRELITGSAEGNPFYMEELVKMLIDQGAIDAGADRWILNADRLISARVPPTLTGVLQARLDGLPALERHALQAASIIGQVFWDEPLSVLDPRAREALPGLVKREIALAGPDLGSDGLREYAFKNQILHQVTYDTVLKRTRRDLHGRLAV